MLTTQRVGFAAMGGDAKAVIDRIIRAEKLGIPAAWLTTTGGIAPDALSIFCAAAMRTERILLGTCITPTWPRHPIVTAQQVQVLGSIAPERFRLGLGPSHKHLVEGTFGYQFDAPLTHTREYINIVRSVLTTGAVDFDGTYYKAHVKIPEPYPTVPILASALRPRAFALCGEITDGAISWVCPPAYLRDVCLPAMKKGAQKANRQTPALVAHIPVVVHDNLEEARNGVREQIGQYPKVLFYQEMFAEAGFPEARTGQWSNAMIDATAAIGNEQAVTARLREILAMGVTEIIAHPLAAGANKPASMQRALEAIASVSR